MASTLVTPPLDRSLTRNPIYITLKTDEMSGAAPEYVPDQENLSCRVEVWRDVPAGEEQLAVLRSPYANVDKRTTFDISRLFPRVIALPTAQSIGVSAGTPYYGEAEGLVDVYRIKHADQYGDPVTPEALTTSDDYLAINGGLPADAIQSINWAGALIGLHSYYYKHADAFSFRKPVATHQPDYLYFIALVTDDIEVTVTRHYDDGTSDSYVSHTIAAEANKAYWTQAGHDQLKLLVDAAVGKTIIAYDVSLVRVTGPQNAFTAFYVIDDMCPVWESFILYHNGFGGYETVRMKGKTRYSHQVTRESFERTRWTDFSPSVGSIEDIRVLGGCVWDTHTGHYPPFYLNHLRQLLHGKLWRIDLELSEALNEHRFLRIQCLTNQVQVYEDDPGRAEGFSIQYRQAWLDDGFNIY